MAVVALTTLAVLAVAAVGAGLGRGPAAPLAARLGIGGPQRLLPVVHPAQASSAYTVSNDDASGDPVTYDPCEPVHYVVNPDGAPADYRDFVGPAIAAAQAASGLEFVDDGTTHDDWESRADGSASGPVLIAFVSRLEGDDVTVDTVGLGGSTTIKVDGRTLPHYVTGAIALKRSWFEAASARHQTAAEQAVVMHELGHVLGLGHVDDPAQLMSPVNRGQLAYGPGDLSGLALLGSGRCGT